MNDNLLKKGKPEWHELSKTVSANGTVLLKNDNNVLPLSDKRISVFGRVQLNTMGHAGCANFSDAFISAGIAVNTELLSLYRKWTEEHPVITGGYVSFSASSYPEMPLSEETVKNAAIKTDTAVVILGRTSCENCDIPVAKGGFMLSDGEEEMFRLVCGSFRHVIDRKSVV